MNLIVTPDVRCAQCRAVGGAYCDECSVAVAAVHELDRRWRRACSLGDRLALAAEDVLDESPAVRRRFGSRSGARRRLELAIRAYEEG
jgi:hypothetical protein